MWRSLIHFFFARESQRTLAVMRILLALALLVDMTPRWRYTVELFSTAGLVLPPFMAIRDSAEPPSPRPKWQFARPKNDLTGGFSMFVGPDAGPQVLAPVPSPTVAVLATSVLLMLIVALGVGWQTRLTLVLVFCLYGWMAMLDGVSNFAKNTVIALHLLLLLTFSGCGRVWSLDAWSRQGQSPLVSAWPRRLMQLLICHVYLGAGITKLRIPGFVTGDPLMFTFMNELWGGAPVGLWLATTDGLMPFLSIATLLFELLFPFLVWVPAYRRVLLAMAVCFHVTILLTISVGAFSYVMLAGLAAFLTEDDLAWVTRITSWLKRLARRPTDLAVAPATVPVASWRWPVASATVYMVALLLAGVTGLIIQTQMDWYGVFSGRGVGEPPEIPRTLAQEMLSGQLPAMTHYHARTVLCRHYSGGQARGERRRFVSGSNVYVHTRLIEPHPDIKIEGLLLDSHGKEVARYDHPIPAFTSVAVDGFELVSELPAGRYKVVVQFDGYEVAAQSFELVK